MILTYTVNSITTTEDLSFLDETEAKSLTLQIWYKIRPSWDASICLEHDSKILLQDKITPPLLDITAFEKAFHNYLTYVSVNGDAFNLREAVYWQKETSLDIKVKNLAQAVSTMLESIKRNLQFTRDLHKELSTLLSTLTEKYHAHLES